MFNLLFESEEGGGSVCGKHGVVGICTHPSGVTLNGIVILSIFEKCITLKIQKKIASLKLALIVNYFTHILLCCSHYHYLFFLS